MRASPSAWCASGSSGSSATRPSSSSIVGWAGASSMSANTSEPVSSAPPTTPSSPRSMKPDCRPGVIEVSSSVSMTPAAERDSSASGSSSTSLLPSIAATSKSGSSSRGGTSTTVLRLGGSALGGAGLPDGRLELLRLRRHRRLELLHGRDVVSAHLLAQRRRRELLVREADVFGLRRLETLQHPRRARPLRILHQARGLDLQRHVRIRRDVFDELEVLRLWRRGRRRPRRPRGGRSSGRRRLRLGGRGRVPIEEP